MSEHTTRRSVLASVAGALAGGAVVGAVGSEPADAAVTLDQLSVPDQQVEVRGDVASVPIECVAGYRWDVPDGAGRPGRWQLRLAVDGAVIATESGRGTSRQQEGTATLSGDVLDAGGFTASEFTPDDGPVRVEVPVTLTLVVLSGRDEVARASQSATGTVEVSAAGYDATLHGSVGGRVAIGVSGE